MVETPKGSKRSLALRGHLADPRRRACDLRGGAARLQQRRAVEDRGAILRLAEVAADAGRLVLGVLLVVIAGRRRELGEEGRRGEEEHRKHQQPRQGRHEFLGSYGLGHSDLQVISLCYSLGRLAVKASGSTGSMRTGQVL